MYGKPQKSKRDVRTLTLDLPVEVRATKDPTGSAPPIRVFGPLAEGETAADFEGEARTPVDVDVHPGGIVEVSFDPPFKRGRYEAVVYPSSILLEDGGSLDLTVDGQPWTGWTFDVLEGDRHGPDTAQTETKTKPQPEREVLIDGEPAGRCQLSGEVITVVTEQDADVDLLFKNLIPGTGESLYEKFVSKTRHTVDGKPAVSFASAGPIYDYTYAVYHGADTVGRLPLDQKGKLAVATPVVREPVPARFAPLIDRGEPEVVTIDGHPNVYERLQYTAEPQNPQAPIGSYEPKPITAPKTIQKPFDTPANNPRLLSDSVYADELPGTDELPGPDTNVAAFDLPLQRQLAVEVNGERIWSGQTRLLPLLVEPRQLEIDLGWNINDRCAALREIWKASMEALRLWSCHLPRNQRPTASMQEYVLTRLANPTNRTGGVQGKASSSLGEQSTSAKSDRAGERRLANLADLLENCEEEVPIDINSDFNVLSAGVAEDARQKYYPRAARKDTMHKIAPTFDPTYGNRPYVARDEFRRLDL